MSTGNLITQSTMAVDAAEEWKNGTKLTSGTAAGADVAYYVVGGVNARASFGLGVWNWMIWETDKTGLACNANASNCGTFTDATDSWGYGPLNLMVMGFKANLSNKAEMGAMNTAMQNSCATSNTMWNK